MLRNSSIDGPYRKKSASCTDYSTSEFKIHIWSSAPSCDFWEKRKIAVKRSVFHLTRKPNNFVAHIRFQTRQHVPTSGQFLFDLRLAFLTLHFSGGHDWVCSTRKEEGLSDMAELTVSKHLTALCCKKWFSSPIPTADIKKTKNVAIQWVFCTAVTLSDIVNASTATSFKLRLSRFDFHTSAAHAYWMFIHPVGCFSKIGFLAFRSCVFSYVWSQTKTK